MDEATTKNEPVVVKKRRRITKVHGGAWKVAYADFVTAMMALFIVLWILNQDQAIVKAVGSYFKAPGEKILRIEAGTSVNTSGKTPTAQLNEKQWREAEKSRFEEMGKSLVQELSKSPEFEGLMNQVKIEIVREGLRIEVMESANDVFFEVGTSQLKPSAVRLMEAIGGQLKQLSNKVVIEGHTDSRPYPGISPNYTNFELSADRANSARRALTAGGVGDKQIAEIRGYADSLLRDRKDPFNVVNRRISIIVKYSSEE
jgi:chemotaxis protein MotB